MATNDSKKKGEDKRRRYVVKEKDTLESIAKKQLRDIRLAALIYEINKHMLPLRMEKGKQVADPRSGTSIWLPSDSDISDFRGRLYSGAPGASSSSAHVPAVPPATTRASEVRGQDVTKSNWEGQGPSSAIAAGMMDVAVAKSQVRQSNIEKVLGPLPSARASEASRIRYIVRLTDTLDGVAVKHPALKDVELWPLLATLNDLSDEVAANGKPVAELRRGMVLDIPTPYEIEEYRQSNPVEDATQTADVPPLSVSETPATKIVAKVHEEPEVPTVRVKMISQPAANIVPPAQQNPTASTTQPNLLQAPIGHQLPSSMFQSYNSGQPTMPLQSVATSPPAEANLPPQVNSQPQSVLHPQAASEPPLISQQTVPFASPATAQAPNTYPSSAVDLPKPVPQPSPGAAGIAPMTPPAEQPLAWQPAPNIFTQLQATHVLPQQSVPGVLSQPIPLNQGGSSSHAPASPAAPSWTNVPTTPSQQPAPAAGEPSAFQTSPWTAQTPVTLPLSAAAAPTSQGNPVSPVAPPSPTESFPVAGGWQQPPSHTMPLPDVLPAAEPPTQLHAEARPPVPLQPLPQNQSLLSPQAPLTSQAPVYQTPQKAVPTQPFPQPQPQPSASTQPQFPPSQIEPQGHRAAPANQSNTGMPAVAQAGAMPGQAPITSFELPAASPPVVKPVNRPTAADIMKRAPIVVGDRYMWELDRSVRLVKSAVRWEPSIGVFRSQLEVLYGGTWYPVIFYEVFPQGSVRHEYVPGAKRKSVKMDLPPTAVQELADNDLVNNWQPYCQRFIAILVGPKS